MRDRVGLPADHPRSQLHGPAPLDLDRASATALPVDRERSSALPPPDVEADFGFWVLQSPARAVQTDAGRTVGPAGIGLHGTQTSVTEDAGMQTDIGLEGIDFLRPDVSELDERGQMKKVVLESERFVVRDTAVQTARSKNRDEKTQTILTPRAAVRASVRDTGITKSFKMRARGLEGLLERMLADDETCLEQSAVEVAERPQGRALLGLAGRELRGGGAELRNELRMGLAGVEQSEDLGGAGQESATVTETRREDVHVLEQDGEAPDGVGAFVLSSDPPAEVDEEDVVEDPTVAFFGGEEISEHGTGVPEIGFLVSSAEQGEDNGNSVSGSDHKVSSVSGPVEEEKNSWF